MTTAFVGIGTNQGDRLETVTSCVFVLDDLDDVAVEDVSAVYETEPVGVTDQPAFLNAVVRVATSLGAAELLAELHGVEAAYGRDREQEQRWGPRPLDLDLLLYGDDEIDEPDLVVPHPRLTERGFVLVPLLEVMPGGELPDGTPLTTALAALAPITGIDLHIRLEEVPGTQHRIQRPAGPGGPGAIPARDWTPPTGPDEGVER